MTSTFVAYGLAIEAGFPLPGPVWSEGFAGAQPLALELTSPAALEAGWSGLAGPRPWRGRLGDGEELEIARGRGDDLLFRYGKHADYHLDRDRSRLCCAPADPAAAAWQRVLLTRVLPNVAIASGYEALHAGAVATDRGVVAIVAAAGAGKSTLALELVRRGHPLFADDTVVLGPGWGGVEAHPAGPFMNLPAQSEPPPGEDLGLLAGERWVAVAGAARRPSRVAAIVLLERGAGKLLGAWPLSGTPLTLAPFALGLPDDSGRDASRFELYADLLEQAKLMRLTAGLGHRPADLAEILERALGLAPLVGETA
ncbi:MAG: hypothetical protein ACRDPE_20045 [Solirubrobacterales bacterium]